MEVLIIDNGAYRIKAGWAGASCTHVNNAIMRSRDRRVWMANDIEQCIDQTSLLFRRPIERGQLLSWELEKAVWDWMFDTNTVAPPKNGWDETCLVLTEAPGSLPWVSTCTDQIVLEEYGVGAYRRTSPQALATRAVARRSECYVVVDVGYTATQIVPVWNDMAVPQAVRRVDVGGRVLTNYLKENVSFRHYNMMEESAIISQIKERACYVALDFDAELRRWRANPSLFNFGYVLPDHRSPVGRALETAAEIKETKADGAHQVLILQNERFSVPEALFEPRQLGFDQAGLPEAVAQAIAAAPLETQPLMWANVVLTGGGAQLPNLSERLNRELRSYAPENVEVDLALISNPVEGAWQGGSILANDQQFLQEMVITKQEYQENGEALVVRKFGRMKA